MPALTRPLAISLAVLGALGVAYTAYTELVAAGVTGVLDLRVTLAMASAWRPGLGPPARAVAVLGGLEVTSLGAAALAVFLWRRGFRSEVAALLVLPLTEALETVSKRLLVHPPPLRFAHPDGPSVVTMWHGGTLTFGGSYPSGHMMRTVLLYGLGAFVVRRLAPPGWGRTLAIVLAGAMVGLMA